MQPSAQYGLRFSFKCLEFVGVTHIEAFVFPEFVSYEFWEKNKCLTFVDFKFGDTDSLYQCPLWYDSEKEQK